MSVFQDIVSTPTEKEMVNGIVDVLTTISEAERTVLKVDSNDLKKAIKYFIRQQRILRSALQGDLNEECRQRAQRIQKMQSQDKDESARWEKAKKEIIN